MSDLEELLEVFIKASTQSLRAIVRLSVVVNVRVSVPLSMRVYTYRLFFVHFSV